MRTKSITVHYCDFCKTRKFTRPAMQKHEKGCTLNPNRICGMCAYELNHGGDRESAPLSELIDLCNTFSINFSANQISVDEFDRKEEENAADLAEAAAHCPACMLAAIRQSGTCLVKFDFKEESKSWWAEFNNDRRYE